MLEKLRAMESKYEELTNLLMDPEVLSKPSELQKYSKEQAELQPIVEKIREYTKLLFDIEGTEELLKEGDGDLRELALSELDELKGKKPKIEEELKIMLLPEDPRDKKNVILEIRAGTGGEEAALFASKLLRMYLKYAEQKRWKVEMIDMNSTGLGGIKEVIASIQGKNAYSRLKYESGVHRVQRVPVTESSGRIHTSASTVAVLPEAEEVDIKIDEKDLRVDTFCSSGPGGQSVNTTYSAVRITHIPTGIVVSCQNERSQIRNRDMARKILRARLYELEREKKRKELQAVEDSKLDIAWGSQIRSYVLHPYRMVKDHRTKYETSNTDRVLDGDIDDFIYQYMVFRGMKKRVAAAG